MPLFWWTVVSDGDAGDTIAMVSPGMRRFGFRGFIEEKLLAAFPDKSEDNAEDDPDRHRYNECP